MPRPFVTIAGEGTTDLVVARRIVRESGLEPGVEYSKLGKTKLDPKIEGYNRASLASDSCWLVLRDLDHDAACASELAARLLPRPAPRMRLHVAVRAIESWLLADEAGVRTMLSTSGRITTAPDLLDDPKRYLLDLAAKSRKRSIRDDMLPAPGSTARVGPGYVGTLSAFVTNQWDVAAASMRSPSLRRLLEFLHGASTRCPTARSPSG